MISLTSSLKALRDFLEGRGTVPTTWDILIVEIGPNAIFDEHGRFHIRRTALHTVAEYEERFKELMEAGFSWLNVSCYGVYEGKTIIAIEVPKPSANSVPQTSVNYSGPAATVLERNWKVDSVLVIEE